MGAKQLAKTSPAHFLQFTADSTDSVEVRYEEGTLWLTQKQMASLFGVTTATINHHLAQVYDESELMTQATIRNYLIVQTEGTRQVTRELLQNAGHISQKIAEKHACAQYEIFRIEQDRTYISDFDRFTAEALASKPEENRP